MPINTTPVDCRVTRAATHRAGLSLRLRADFLTVRAALEETEFYLESTGASVDLRSSVQIVLAEVLTNIVRHGYDHTQGEVWLQVNFCGQIVHMEVTDNGIPFNPEPLGHCAPDLSALPEGGYGWYMIRQLCSAVSYARNNCNNHLDLRVSEPALRD